MAGSVGTEQLPPLESDFCRNVLLPYQRQHVRRLKQIITTSYFAEDRSAMGAGKTFAATGLCKEHNLRYPACRILVLCSTGLLKQKWESICATYDINCLGVFTYCELAGRHGSQEQSSRFNLLLRTDERVGDHGRSTTYSLQQEFQDRLLDTGVFVVCDEYHAVKNTDSCRNKMIRPIASFIRHRAPHCSKLLMISGTPLDKEGHALAFFRAIGVFTARRLVTVNNLHFKYGRYDLPPYLEIKKDGLAEIENFVADVVQDKDRLRRLAIATVEGARDDYQMSIRFAQYRYKYVFQLFLELSKYTCSEMVNDNCSRKVFKCNMKCLNDGVDTLRLCAAIDELKKVTGYRDGNNEVGAEVAPVRARPGDQDEDDDDPENNAENIYRAITKAMKKIEQCKIPTFIRLAERILEENDNYQVVIALNFIETIDSVSRALKKKKKYNPLVIKGEVKGGERLHLVEQFQQDSNQHRLLIANLNLIKEGIDLDNKHKANRLRFVLVSPNYYAIVLHQLAYRFVRANSTTDAVVMHIFQRDGYCEENVLKSLQRKGQIMSTVTRTHHRMGVSFLHQYPEYVEGNNESSLFTGLFLRLRTTFHRSSEADDDKYCSSEELTDADDNEVAASMINDDDEVSETVSAANVQLRNEDDVMMFGEEGVYDECCASVGACQQSVGELRKRSRSSGDVVESAESTPTNKRQRSPTAVPPSITSRPAGPHQPLEQAPEEQGLEEQEGALMMTSSSQWSLIATEPLSPSSSDILSVACQGHGQVDIGSGTDTALPVAGGDFSWVNSVTVNQRLRALHALNRHHEGFVALFNSSVQEGLMLLPALFGQVALTPDQLPLVRIIRDQLGALMIFTIAAVHDVPMDPLDNLSWVIHDTVKQRLCGLNELRRQQSFVQLFNPSIQAGLHLLPSLLNLRDITADDQHFFIGKIRGSLEPLTKLSFQLSDPVASMM